jgi:thymidylate kinase
MNVATAPALHPAVASAVAALESSRARWALLRLPEGGLFAPNGDVDILVHPADCPSAASALRAAGFVRVPRAGGDIHMVQYCQESDRWFWLHVTTKVTFGRHELRLDGDGGLISQRRVVEGIPRLDADTDFWALLWHCLADKGSISAHHGPAVRLGAISARCDGPGARCLASAARSRHIASMLLDAIINDDSRAIETAVATIRRATARDRGPLPARAWRGIARRIDALWHVRDRRGLSIAVVGPDGAGKTTIVDSLGTSTPFPTRIVYMGLTGGALRHVRRLRVPGLVFVASVAVIWGRYLRSRVEMARGRWVVFERYVYDAIAPSGIPQGRLARAGRRLFLHVLPNPDVILVLDAPGDVMYARKHEYDANTLEAWRRQFLTLPTHFRNVEIVDATRGADAVRADAVARIWACCVRRWREGEPGAARPS